MLSAFFVWLAISSLGIVVLGWVIYPLALACFSRGDAPPHGSAATPGVTVIIATREPLPIVRDRVANLLLTDYPASQLQIVVALDHSVAAGHEEYSQALGSLAEVVVGDAPAGKAAALNAGVRAASNDILVFTDSMQSFAPDAVRQLVAALSSGIYSAVSGRLLTGSGEPQAGILGAFWNYEIWIRRHEARLHSVIGVTGAIYAMHRSLWRPLPAGILCDDVAVPMRLVLDGRRVGLCNSAIATDPRRFSPFEEYRRKVRTQTGILQLCRLFPPLLSPRQNPLWVQFVCHKLIRLATPVLLLLAAPGMVIWLGRSAPAVAAVLGALALAVAAATRGRALKQGLTLFLMLGAPLLAIYCAATGNWEVWKAPTPVTNASPKRSRSQ